MPLIHVQMLGGRTLAQKRQLADVLSSELARIANCSKEEVQVVISEFSTDNWATGGKLVSDSRVAGVNDPLLIS